MTYQSKDSDTKICIALFFPWSMCTFLINIGRSPHWFITCMLNIFFLRFHFALKVGVRKNGKDPASCKKHWLWVYEPVLDRLVPSSLNPALSAAATRACAKLPLVKMESSEELPTLDLWLEKLRSSSDAEPHPFISEPKNKCRGLVSCTH